MKGHFKAFHPMNWSDLGRVMLIFLACLGILYESNSLIRNNASAQEIIFWQLLIVAVGIYFFYTKFHPRTTATELNDLKRKLRHMETFQDVASRIAGESTIANQLKLITSALSRLMKTPRISIMLLRENHLEIIESLGLPDEIKHGTRIKLGDGVAGWVMEKGKPLILNGPIQGNRFENFIHKDTPILSALCIPLKFQDQKLGVLNMSRNEDGNYFTEDDLHIIETFSNEVSIILHKELLIEKLTEQMNNLKMAQKELMHAEKLGDIGTLISGLSHELNNYLTPLKGYLQMMNELAEDPEKVKRYSGILNEVVDSMAKLVSELLDLSRKKEQMFEEIQLNEMAQRIVHLFRLRLKGTNIQLKVDLDPRLSEILADGPQIKQVVLNLLNNAFQSFEKPEGIIRIYTQNESGNVILGVRDSGKGIPEGVLKKIFEPFFTTKGKEGTGLGLKICKKIMESHRGKIEIFSEPDKGTEIRLCFPANVPRGTIKAA